MIENGAFAKVRLFRDKQWHYAITTIKKDFLINTQ